MLALVTGWFGGEAYLDQHLVERVFALVVAAEAAALAARLADRVDLVDEDDARLRRGENKSEQRVQVLCGGAPLKRGGIQIRPVGSAPQVRRLKVP